MLNQDRETKAVKITLKAENKQKYFRLCCKEYKAATEICDHNTTRVKREE